MYPGDLAYGTDIWRPGRNGDETRDKIMYIIEGMTVNGLPY